MNSGHSTNWFNGDFDFTLDFINNIGSEIIGNFLMFLPFGFLYPLSKKELKWKNIVLRGFLFILNSLGILISTTIFTIIKKLQFSN